MEASTHPDLSLFFLASPHTLTCILPVAMLVLHSAPILRVCSKAPRSSRSLLSLIPWYGCCLPSLVNFLSPPCFCCQHSMVTSVDAECISQGTLCTAGHRGLLIAAVFQTRQGYGFEERHHRHFHSIRESTGGSLHST